jgi:hypothetical protein
VQVISRDSLKAAVPTSLVKTTRTKFPPDFVPRMLLFFPSIYFTFILKTLTAGYSQFPSPLLPARKYVYIANLVSKLEPPGGGF